MRLKLLIPNAEVEKAKEQLAPHLKNVEHEQAGESTLEMVILIDPSDYREVDQIVRKNVTGGSLELLANAVHAEGDEKIE